jgi:glyceraldehyde 3-phosphate dehydrogenase
MAVKVGINGFGRIGRNVLRASLGNPDIEFVAVNDLTSPATLAHLLKYDSILGNLKNEIVAGEDFISVDGKKLKVFAQKDPALLPWDSVGRADRGRVDRALYRCDEGESASARSGEEGHHLGSRDQRRSDGSAGREREEVRSGEAQHYFERIVHDELPGAGCEGAGGEIWALCQGIMTTIHSYTNDQVILDFPHKDLRRARAAALSMIPTSTGAAKALKLVIPEWKASWTGSRSACLRRTSRWST